MVGRKLYTLLLFISVPFFKLFPTNSINTTTSKDVAYTKISHAINSGREKKAIELLNKEFLKDREFVNCTDCENTTFLMIACWRNSKEVADFLIGENADITKKDINQRNALLTSVAAKNIEIVKLLLKKAREKLSDNEFKSFLNSKDSDGLNVLLLASWVNAVEIVSFLLNEAKEKLSDNEFKSFLNSKDNLERTSLCIAAWFNSEVVVKILLSEGAKKSNSVKYSKKSSPTEKSRLKKFIYNYFYNPKGSELAKLIERYDPNYKKNYSAHRRNNSLEKQPKKNRADESKSITSKNSKTNRAPKPKSKNNSCFMSYYLIFLTLFPFFNMDNDNKESDSTEES